MTPTLSVEAVHDRLICVGEAEPAATVAVSPDGAVGGVVSGGGGLLLLPPLLQEAKTKQNKTVRAKRLRREENEVALDCWTLEDGLIWTPLMAPKDSRTAERRCFYCKRKRAAGGGGLPENNG